MEIKAKGGTMLINLQFWFWSWGLPSPLISCNTQQARWRSRNNYIFKISIALWPAVCAYLKEKKKKKLEWMSYSNTHHEFQQKFSFLQNTNPTGKLQESAITLKKLCSSGWRMSVSNAHQSLQNANSTGKIFFLSSYSQTFYFSEAA